MQIIVRIRDDNGLPKTGLTPKIWLYYVSDNSVAYGADNSSMTEIGRGWYKYDCTATYAPKNEIVGDVDAGATITSPYLRYLDISNAVKSAHTFSIR